MFRGLVGAMLLVASLGLGAWTPGRWFEKPKSDRWVGYHLVAGLDWEKKVLTGKALVSWRNGGSAATSELPLHLYLNAFKGTQSLFFKEGGRPTSGVADPAVWGYCQLKSVLLEGRKLDGHFGEDETVYWVKLPKAVQPGERIRLEIQWESRFPKVRARSGWGGDFLMGAQWFPKVGVYQGDRWICHAYHRDSEFFSDFGTYDVELSLPGGLLLAHTGTQTNFRTQEDITPDPHRRGHVIWKLHAEDVHDFAWAAMPSRSWGFRSLEYRGVQLFFFFQPENRGNLERQIQAVKAALRYTSEWYFPYPYPVLTVVDVPREAAAADGMEYPTLITASSVPFEPFRCRGRIEELAIHEFGHQFFYGILASNETEEPWLDEGLTSWFTARVLERAYQGGFSSRRFQAGTGFVDWKRYWETPDVDPVLQTSFQARDDRSAQVSAYHKPVLVLNQLEAWLGQPMLEQVLKAYAREMAFKHPTGSDFRRIAERVSGRSLGGFWRDYLEGTEVLDVVIGSVRSPEAVQGGWLEAGSGLQFVPPQPIAPGRTGSITLVRRGGIRVPITLWVRLENRQEYRMLWDGQDRWVSYDFESPIVSAVLDPDGNYPMLKDRLHASYTAHAKRRGFHYWSQMLWGAITGLLQGIGLG